MNIYTKKRLLFIIKKVIMDITKHELYVAPFIKVYAFNCMGNLLAGSGPAQPGLGTSVGGFEDGGVEDLDGE